jgi:hypothetical protein
MLGEKLTMKRSSIRFSTGEAREKACLVFYRS